MKLQIDAGYILSKKTVGCILHFELLEAGCCYCSLQSCTTDWIEYRPERGAETHILLKKIKSA